MNKTELARVMARVMALDPTMVGGNDSTQRERTATLLVAFGPATTDRDALQAINGLVRSGKFTDRVSWSDIIAETLACMRRRIDSRPTLDDPLLVPKPADFDQRVAYWRDKKREDAVRLRSCPDCGAMPGEACNPSALAPERLGIKKRELAAMSEDSRIHYARYDFTSR
jgi:hypothetical protein